jgi:hypothetical protein
LDGTQVRHSTNNERYLASSDVSGLQHPEHMGKMGVRRSAPV